MKIFTNTVCITGYPFRACESKALSSDIQSNIIQTCICLVKGFPLHISNDLRQKTLKLLDCGNLHFTHYTAPLYMDISQQKRENIRRIMAELWEKVIENCLKRIKSCKQPCGRDLNDIVAQRHSAYYEIQIPSKLQYTRYFLTLLH